VERFVLRLAEGGPVFCEQPYALADVTSFEQEGGGGRRTEVKIALLAQEVLQEIQSGGGLGTKANSEVQSAASQFRAAMDHTTMDEVRIKSALDGVRRLKALLEAPDEAGAGCRATAHELEAMEIPQALHDVLEYGFVSVSSLVEQLGVAGSVTLAAALLRIVESTEVLPVPPLPPYLSLAPGLRVLCEPLVVVLANGGEADTSRPAELTLQCAPELEQRWLQIEPLLRVEELERLVLMTSPIQHNGFLTWCLELVGHDVAVFSADDTSCTVFGHVLDFHLATPLRIPVHTVRRASDGREVVLVASLHGLAAIEKEEEPPRLEGLELRVALLQMEAALSPCEFNHALKAVCNAARERQAVVDREDSNASNVVNCAAVPVLGALGFTRADVAGSFEWTERSGYEREMALLEQIAEQHLAEDGGLRQRAQAKNASAYEVLEPDAEMVSMLAAVFPEHAAKRACVAVKNASVEAAMDWACQHQGDPDFNDPFPDSSANGCSADPRAPVWSVFIVLPQGVPFDLVWPMLEDPVKGALTSVANAWTAMGWAGGEVEMRNTLRSLVEKTGEGTIARGLQKEKADRVASRLKHACECRVDADPEGAANAPRGGGGPRSGGTANGEKSVVVGTRVQLVLEADKLGIVAAVAEDIIPNSSFLTMQFQSRRVQSFPNHLVLVVRCPSSHFVVPS
jgi:hypothetical protein